MQLTATHCSSLQLTATHCNSLLLTTTHCNSLQHFCAISSIRVPRSIYKCVYVCARACCLRLSTEPHKQKEFAKGQDIAIEAQLKLIVYDPLLKQMQILSGIQFPRHFIEFVVVETNKFVGNNANVMLTRQTCGQRSGTSSGRKCRALAIYCSV